MVEWPHERRLRESRSAPIPPRISDIPQELLLEARNSRFFAALVREIADAFNRHVDPKLQIAELVARINESADFSDSNEAFRDAVLALACVDALRGFPTREMWEFLWSLAWHSGSLANLLPEAVVAASAEGGFRTTFLEIARNAVRHAQQNPGRRAIPGEEEMAANLPEAWRKNRRLSELWRNNFTHSFHAVGRDDDNVLSIVAQIDLAEFVQLLTIFDYPEPVAHALTWCGGAWRYERWKALLFAAPVAFEAQGAWNGSLILPLLLSVAREQFQFPLSRNPIASQVSKATSEITALATEVARCVAVRPDALGCTVRWGSWLIRTGMPAVSSNPSPHPSDAGSYGFIEVSILDSLISEMPGGSWIAESAPDSEPWEPWCHLALGAIVALSKSECMPSPSHMLAEWALSPEEWSSSAGQLLNARALPFEVAQPRADGYGARLLALSLVEAEPADTSWRKFWNSTATLREIVEFGDLDEAENAAWQGRRDAAGLLMLQFSIGLMLLDHLTIPQPKRTFSYERRSAIERLLPLLRATVREMAAIDQINGKFWSGAIRHLAIRRATWLSDRGKRLGAVDGITLDPEVKPTLADFFCDLVGDTENLLVLVYMALQNEAQKEDITVALVEAQIDILAEIDIAEQLMQMSRHALTLSLENLNTLRGLWSDRAEI